MKSAPVFLIVACSCFFSLAQEVVPQLGQSVNVQHVLKFSGTLINLQRPTLSGNVTLHLAIYNEPNEGDAYWQETQTVLPDIQGRYTVLLGEATFGGLPAEVFEASRVHWLGVRISGQPEQPRVLLVELPATLKSPRASSVPVLEASRATPSERRMTLLLVTMFLVGVAMAFGEVLKWWKAFTERDRGSPAWWKARAKRDRESAVAKLLGDLANRDGLEHVAQRLWLPISGGLRGIRRRFRHSVTSIDHLQRSMPNIEQPKKAA